MVAHDYIATMYLTSDLLYHRLHQSVKHVWLATCVPGQQLFILKNVEEEITL